MSDNFVVPPALMKKEIVVKEDGRYLIYYRFQKADDEKLSRTVLQKLENSLPQPAKSLTSKSK